MHSHRIDAAPVSIDQLECLISGKTSLVLSEESRNKVRACREYLDRRIAESQDPIYGVTTGFGSLCNHSISPDELGTLQQNLVMSHACGMGEEVPAEIVRLMLYLKIRSLAYGHSGICPDTLDRLIWFYNQDILPVIYNQGSLGASGDLSPLAHLSLPLIGMGEVMHRGRRKKAEEVLAEYGKEAIRLKSKEGLALLNGTQFMSAYGVFALIQGKHLSAWADLIGALSLEAFNGRIDPFIDQVHQARNHPGQISTAARIRKILHGSQLIAQKGKQVQDPYSFRCLPQVHGATKDTLEHVERVIANEVNAVTDNPTLFPEDDLIVSAGNFHGQPLALVLDFMAIALAELGNISERRVYRLISGTRRLPSFLVAKPGLNSGFMIPQYAAASIVSQNKQLCTPASVDSIESSQGQEDHVSMGANAAVKALQVVVNLEKLLGIELMNASQAMAFRQEENTSAVLRKLLADFRQQVPFVENDTLMYLEMEKARAFVSRVSPYDYIPAG